jgi:hypothetical protein
MSPYAARLAGLVLHAIKVSYSQGRPFLLHINQTNIHMEKIIAKENLADFIMKMWDSNIRVDLRPSDNTITLWSDNLHKHTYVCVGYADYEDVVADVIKELNEGLLI